MARWTVLVNIDTHSHHWPALRTQIRCVSIGQVMEFKVCQKVFLTWDLPSWWLWYWSHWYLPESSLRLHLSGFHHNEIVSDKIVGEIRMPGDDIDDNNSFKDVKIWILKLLLKGCWVPVWYMIYGQTRAPWKPLKDLSFLSVCVSLMNKRTKGE